MFLKCKMTLNRGAQRVGFHCILQFWVPTIDIFSASLFACVGICVFMFNKCVFLFDKHYVGGHVCVCVR